MAPQELTIRNEACDPTKSVIYLYAYQNQELGEYTLTIPIGRSETVTMPDFLFGAQDDVTGQIEERDEQIASLQTQVQDMQKALTQSPAAGDPQDTASAKDDQIAELQEQNKHAQEAMSVLADEYKAKIRNQNVTNLEAMQKEAGLPAEGKKNDRLEALEAKYDSASPEQKVQMYKQLVGLEEQGKE